MAKNLVDSIQMEVRSKQPCRKELDFVVPADAVKSEMDRVVQEFAGAVSIPGFRQGKAPTAMLKSRYAEEIRQELERKIVYAAFDLAGKDESLDIVTCGIEGEPKLEFDKEFKFTLGADVAPEFELGDYKTVKVTEALDAVTEEQIDARLKTYRAMKSVLLVHDRDTGREVAMAIMPDFRERPKIDLERFVREARLTAQLEHPNIVPVHDLGIDSSGSPFFTMKYLHGQSLSAVIRKLAKGDAEAVHRFSQLRLLQIFIRICNAIEFAHSQGICHLDIKPENVNIGDFGEVLLLDWGLARAVDPESKLVSPNAEDIDANGHVAAPHRRAEGAESEPLFFGGRGVTNQRLGGVVHT